MAQDIYRDNFASKDRDPSIEAPRATASYSREPSRPLGESPFLVAVAIAVAIAVAAVAFVSVQPDKMNAPTTSEQPMAPATH